MACQQQHPARRAAASSRRPAAAAAALILLLLASSHERAHAAPAPAAVKWQVLHKQGAKQHGSHSQPSIRYGHTCAAHHGQLVSSHGYFYNREDNTVQWLSDTWLMPMKPPYQWKRLSPGITQDEALASYQAGKVPPAPCGRFGHADSMLNHTLYMYGGHDGGYSRHGQQNYAPEHDFEELWSFDFDTHRWSLVEPSSSSSPGKRYLAALTGVDDELLLYGGMNEGQGDVWSFNVLTSTWRQLVAEEPANSTVPHPGRRVGHTLTPVHFPHGGARGFVLIGGREVSPEGTWLPSEYWFFDLDALHWRMLHVDTPEAQPTPRVYHAEAHTYVVTDFVSRTLTHETAAMIGIIAGGSTATPQLACAADAWAFTIDCGASSIAWFKLPDMPVALYDLRAAADPSAVYVFGGHLCELKTGFPFYYTNQVLRLEIDPLINPLVQHWACQIDRRRLLDEAPHAHGGHPDAHDEL